MRRTRSLTLMLLYALPAMSLLVPQGTRERTYVRETIFAALVFGLAFGIVLRSVLLRLKTVPRKLLHPLLLSFLSYILVFSPLVSLSGGSSLRDVLITALPFGILGFYYLYVVRDVSEQHFLPMIDGWIIAGLLQCGLVIFAFATSTRDETGYYRATGIDIGGQQALVLPVLAQGALFAMARGMLTEQSRRRLLYWLAFGTYAVATLMTVTRALALVILIGMMVAFAAIALVLRRTRPLFITSLVLAVPVAATLPYLIPMWKQRTLDPAEFNTVLGRLDEIRASFTAFAESPLLGKGVGHRLVYPSVWDLILSTDGIMNPHNQVAFMFAIGGLVGAALYYWLMLDTGVRAALLLKRHRTDIELFSGVLGLLIALIAGVIFTLTTTMYSAISYNVFLAFIIYFVRRLWNRAVTA